VIQLGGPRGSSLDHDFFVIHPAAIRSGSKHAIWVSTGMEIMDGNC
jgi:hypothetical protein